MPFGLKSIWMQLSAQVLVLALFLWWVPARILSGQYDGADGLALLGWTLLTLIGVMVVAVVVVHVVGLVAIAIVEGGREPDTTTDERDLAIEQHGARISHAVSGIGVAVSFVLLAAGLGAPLAFATILGVGMVGEIIANLVKLRTYAGG